MRDDPTVRLNTGAAAERDGSSRTTAVRTTVLRAASPARDDASPAADGSAGEGHAPGPGLVIPPAARERRERPQQPADRPVMPARTEQPGAEQHESRDGGDGSSRTVRMTTARPHRPVPASGPAGPARPVGPRHTGPGRPVMPAGRAPRTSEVPSRARTRAPQPRGRTAGLLRRTGAIAAAVALGLVAVVSACWTLMVPPAGHDDRPAVAPVAPPGPPGPTVRWVRTNGDEFEGPSLDRTRWNVYNSAGGFGNGLRRPSAVTQDAGLLTITARPRLNGGTSGGISMGKGQLHGRWEFRARADPGVGYSPAVLLWPDSERFPADGELDMLESPQRDRRTATAYVHYGADNKTRGAQVSGDFTQWHTFAFEWLPDRLTWYVDGQKAWEITDRTVIPTKPMHLCIQLDQGPAVKFMPGPDASTPEQVRMQIDWARQFRVG